MENQESPRNSDSQQLPKIDATAKTIQACFTQCIYSVPEFQRPYSWEGVQLEDYWNDVVMANGDLFFGTIVTWISKERELFANEYSLIDGQQRLTTSAIALSVVRDWLGVLAGSENTKTVKEESRARAQARTLASSTQKYLVMIDDDGEEHAIIERPEQMFWQFVQQPDAIPSGAKWGESASRIGEARKFFEEKVSRRLDNADSVDAKVSALRDIRNNVLKARLIQVELEKEEDAFLIFETLNTRGSDLQLKDLVKNDLVRGASRKRKDREAVSQRWQKVIDSVVVDGSSTDAGDSFIWQSWNSRRNSVKQGELYKALKTLFADGKLDRIRYLEELEVDASIYKYLDAGCREFPKEDRGARISLAVREVQDAICALAAFNVTVANSAVLALIRKFEETSILSQKNLVRAICAIEKFHFQNTQLASSGSTGGTRGRYNRFAVEIDRAETAGEVCSAVDRLIEKLRGSLPKPEIVKARFGDIFYAPGIPLVNAQRKLGDQEIVRYVLMSIAKCEGAVQSTRRSEDWTIEHILPQANASGVTTDPVYGIGNLTLLAKGKNSSVGSGDFRSKRDQLRDYSVLHDVTLSRWIEDPHIESLTEYEILRRSNALSEYAIDVVWSF